MKRDHLVLVILFFIALVVLFLWSSVRVANLINIPEKFSTFNYHLVSENSTLFKADLSLQPETSSSISDSFSNNNNNSKKHEDKQVTSGQKILCWVMTIDRRENLEKSKAVVETWGKRCDKLLLVRNGTKLELSSSPDKVESVLTLPIKHESRKGLWLKVQQAFKFIYKQYLNDYDWFLKTDDDTYVLVENLRDFLSKHSANERAHFGYRFKPFVKQGYMSGGAGYVLSRESVRLLVEEGLNKRLEACHLNSSVEDVEIGNCLEAVQVKVGDTRDSKGRPRFLPLNPEWLLTNKTKKEFWYYWYWFYGPPGTGKDCCSNQPISFHYISPALMRMIDWLLYDVILANSTKQNSSNATTVSEPPEPNSLSLVEKLV